MSLLCPVAEEGTALELVSGLGSATGAGICIRGLVAEQKNQVILGVSPRITVFLPTFTALCSRSWAKAQSTVPHLPLTWEWSFSIAHFTEEETESQKGEVNHQDW